MTSINVSCLVDGDESELNKWEDITCSNISDLNFLQSCSSWTEYFTKYHEIKMYTHTPSIQCGESVSYGICNLCTARISATFRLDFMEHLFKKHFHEYIKAMLMFDKDDCFPSGANCTEHTHSCKYEQLMGKDFDFHAAGIVEYISDKINRKVKTSNMTQAVTDLFLDSSDTSLFSINNVFERKRIIFKVAGFLAM